MAEKILQTRILNKIDTLENWNKSSLKIKQGEICLATVAAAAGTGLEEPVVMAKIGTAEEKTFAELPWSFYSKASDVLAACKTEAGLTAFIKNVVAAADGDLAALVARVDTAEDDIDALQAELDTAETGLKARMTTAEADIDALEGLMGENSVADQIATALANYTTTIDMNAAIAAAKSEAVSHADGLNTAMNTRVEALEAIDHDHANKAELDLIATGDKAKWDAMEQNAKDYADGLNTAMDERVDALEAKFTGEDSVDSKIAAAVAAEAELREAADADLQEQIGVASAEGVEATGLHARIEDLEDLVGDTKVSEAIATAVAAEAEIARAAEKANADAIDAIEADYLKAADKTELQNQITTNANAIELLTNGVSADEVDGVNDLIQYVKDHGTEVTGMKEDISDNADAIAAEKERAEGVEGGLDTRLKAVEAAVGGEGSVADAIDAALTEAKGYTDTEVKELADGAVATNAAAIADLESLVGDTEVATQITNVTNPLAERIVALEAVDHEHANKTVLDGIEAADITAWDAKVDDVTAAADSGLKATRTGNTVAIEIDDSVTFIFDCGDSGVTA